MNKGILFVTGLVLSVLVMSGMVMAVQGNGPVSEPTQASVIVPGWISVTLTNGTPINFGTLSPGGDLTVALGAQLTVKIGGETNVITDTEVSGTDFSGSLFPVTRMKFNGQLNTGSLGSEQSYSTSLQEVNQCQNVAPTDNGNICLISHKISVPLAMPAGTYTSTVLVNVKPATA